MGHTTNNPKKTAHIMTIPCAVYIGFSPSAIFLATNLRVSSNNTTGRENFMTTSHSSTPRGHTWNTACGKQLTTSLETFSSCLPVPANYSDNTYRKNVDVQDDEMKSEGESHRAQQPGVGPWGHGNQRLILRQTVKQTKINTFYQT